MAQRCAVVRLVDGVVVNVVMATPGDDAGDGYSLVAAEDYVDGDGHWFWDGVAFFSDVIPIPPAEEPPVVVPEGL